MNQLIELGLMFVLVLLPSALNARDLECNKGIFLYTSTYQKLSVRSCCIQDQAIDSNDNAIASTSYDRLVEAFVIRDNKDVEFIPYNIGSTFAHLIFLVIQKCSVKIVESKHFEKMPNLRALDLAGNKIEKLPSDAFLELQNLEVLVLKGNQLVNLNEHHFGSLYKLVELHLGQNKIERLPRNLLAKLSNLEFFAISGNRLTTLNENFFAMNQKLKKILLYENNITTLSTKLFDDKKSLRLVFLGGNRCVDSKFDGPEALIEMRKVLAENCSPRSSPTQAPSTFKPTAEDTAAETSIVESTSIETTTQTPTQIVKPTTSRPKQTPRALCSKPEAFMITAFSLFLISVLFLLSFAIKKYLETKPE